MLDEHRVRKFFTAEPDRVLRRVRSFVHRNGGSPGSGFQSLTVFTFQPETDHDRRFLQVSVRDQTQGSNRPVKGNLTLRFRDESEGRFHALARRLLDTISHSFDLHDHPHPPSHGNS